MCVCVCVYIKKGKKVNRTIYRYPIDTKVDSTTRVMGHTVCFFLFCAHVPADKIANSIFRATYIKAHCKPHVIFMN